jgi:glucose-6-phosphate isomerase
VLVHGTLGGIDWCDQGGVVVGKTLAPTIIDELHWGVAGDGHDSSTTALISRYLAGRDATRTSDASDG